MPVGDLPACRDRRRSVLPLNIRDAGNFYPIWFAEALRCVQFAESGSSMAQGKLRSVPYLVSRYRVLVRKGAWSNFRIKLTESSCEAKCQSGELWAWDSVWGKSEWSTSWRYFCNFNMYVEGISFSKFPSWTLENPRLDIRTCLTNFAENLTTSCHFQLMAWDRACWDGQIMKNSELRPL
jgi:hypothetical protein